MSDEPRFKAEVWRVFLSVVASLTLGMVAIIGWFIVQSISAQRIFNDQINARVSALEMRSADISVVALDKRVSLNEAAIAAMKAQLEKSDAKLDLILKEVRKP